MYIPLCTFYLLSDIFAIIGRDLYGLKDPGRYGNIFLAGISLFQLLTLDDWFEMYSDVAKNYNGEELANDTVVRL